MTHQNKEGMEELLPCPFCGHDDQLYPCYDFPGTGPCKGIDCLRCGIEFVPREGMDVFAAWNRRAPDTASQAQLKIYREALEAFVNVRDQFPESAKLIDTRFDGHQPISVTVTLDQFRAARTALSQEAGE